MRRKLIITTLVLVLFFSFNVIVAAGPGGAVPAPTPCPSGSVDLGTIPTQGKICLKIFQPFAGIASRGLISALANLFNIMFLLLFVLWIVTLVISVFSYVRSNGDEGLVEEGQKGITNIFRGITIGFLAFIGVAAAGILFGLGMPYNWPDELAQCGPERKLYMNSKNEEFEAARTAGIPSGTRLNFYCCDLDKSVPLAQQGWKVYDPSVAPPYCESFKIETLP